MPRAATNRGQPKVKAGRLLGACPAFGSLTDCPPHQGAVSGGYLSNLAGERIGGTGRVPAPHVTQPDAGVVAFLG